jgi:pyrimidine operon attenuation protein/uracil phosphoribosyltransferase
MIMAAEKNYILDQATAEKKLRRMALEILEDNPDSTEIILAGIRGSGTVIARRIQAHLAEFSPVKVQMLTISLDKRNPTDVTLSENTDCNNKLIIVTDDVANSGRTLLFALKPFLAFHPARIQVLVLIQRTHNDFPVHPDYVGIPIATTLQEHICVETEGDTVTGAYLE